MKTIQLTHGRDRLNLSEKEAVSLHKALSKALDAAGVDPLKHSEPNGVQTFQRGEQCNPTLTDC